LKKKTVKISKNLIPMQNQNIIPIIYKTTSTTPISPSEIWAIQTSFFGISGLIFGLTKSLLSSSPLRGTLFISVAYGANSTLVFGTLFGIRSIGLQTIPSDILSPSLISALAGVITGGSFTGIVSGIHRIPQGALLWGTGCYTLQYLLDYGLEWRNARANEIWEKRGYQKDKTEKIDKERNDQETSKINDSINMSNYFESMTLQKNNKQVQYMNEKERPIGIFSSFFSNAFIWFPFYKTTFETDKQLLERLKIREMDLERELGMRKAPEPDIRTREANVKLKKELS
jgi:hypothetical protein